MSGAYVLDASVIAKWYLIDEEAAGKAASLLEAFTRGELTLIAPSLAVYEVTRAIHKAYRQRRIAWNLAQDRLDDLLSLNLELFLEPEVLRSALRLAFRYGCSFYDACYLALAELLDVPFVSADSKLERQLAGRVDYFLPLERFVLQS